MSPERAPVAVDIDTTEKVKNSKKKKLKESRGLSNVSPADAHVEVNSQKKKKKKKKKEIHEERGENEEDTEEAADEGENVNKETWCEPVTEDYDEWVFFLCVIVSTEMWSLKKNENTLSM